MSEWKPRPSDIEWTRNLINKISEGGVWAIPAANNSMIKLFHSSKSYNATIYAKTPSETGVMLQTMTVLKELDYLADSIIWDSMGVIKDSLLRDFQKENM
jgi:hypothetical protein